MECGLRQNPIVDGVEHQFCLDRQINKGQLRDDLFWSSEIPEKIGPPLIEGLAQTGSAIDHPATEALYGSLQ